MLSSNERDSLLAVLQQDKRPWPLLKLHDGDVIAEIMLPATAYADAAALVAEARTLGFRVEREEKVLLSGAADALHYIVLAFQYVGGAAGVVVAIDKASSVVAEKFRKLKALLTKHQGDITYAPAVHVSLIRDWFDSRYGDEKWAYDPDAIEVKPIGDITVYRIKEEHTGTQYLLAVKDQAVTELEPPKSPSPP